MVKVRMKPLRRGSNSATAETVRLDPVRIVQVVVLQEAQEIRLAGLDHVAQAPGRVGAIADEIELLDGGLATFGDLEHQIDAVVRPVDDLGLDADVVAPGAAIDLDDALDVGLRGFDWISAISCSSLTRLLPSNWMRLITEFSTTVTTRRPPSQR